MSIKKVYMSEDTEKLLNQKIISIVNQEAKIQKVEEPLIKAIIQVESQKYAFAFRVENHLKKAKWYLKTLNDVEKKNNFAYCSYGLMQILYGVAKSLGYLGTPFELHNPEMSIKYGTKLLKKISRRYKNVKDIISAYNQGSPRKDKNGKYLNAWYVKSVYKYYKKFGGVR